MISYTVAATFSNEATAERWREWLRGGHVAEVRAGGALAAELRRIDGSAIAYEVVYRFADRASFAAYERDHAPRLREEGRRLFPPEDGIIYSRTVASIVETYP